MTSLGTSEVWCLIKFVELRDSIKADHGYYIGSRVIVQFTQMLSEFTAEERRLFLSFCTGSPRLPIGGFKALNPPLTIVRKSVEKSVDVNKCLPSVMTCLNYLKIPEYSDQKVMTSAFLYAMKEGQNSFHLS
jgi:E3 ubiquitin-protein ligase TRIP12